MISFFHFLEKKAKINNLKVVTFGLSKSSDISLLKISNEKKNKVLTIKTSDQTFKIRGVILITITSYHHWLS